MKYAVVTGGVVSGLGKGDCRCVSPHSYGATSIISDRNRVILGITSSSIGVMLKASGLNVTAIKIDPYLVSARSICPFTTCDLTI